MGNHHAHHGGRNTPLELPVVPEMGQAGDNGLPPVNENIGLFGVTFRQRITAPRSSKEFTLMYIRKQDLGEGMTGKVIKIVDRSTRERALKMAYGADSIAERQLKELRRETAFLRALDHPNISKLLDCFEDGVHSVQVVVDFARGGNLNSASAQARLQTEANVACVIYQVLLAVNYLHLRGIAHRDIKEENIMFVSPERSSLHIVLIDYGLSSYLGMSTGSPDVRRLHTFCGTLPYMSPEVIQSNYDLQSDLWSVGVLAFELLTGRLPFESQSDKDLIKQIRKARIDYSSERWARLSPNALELVQHLLVLNPAKRWNAALALRSPWFNLVHNLIEKVTPEVEDKLVASLRNFMSYNDARKLLSMVAAHYQFPPAKSDALEVLQRFFMMLDSDRDGLLSKDEFGYLLEKHGMSHELDVVFNMVDYDGSGSISWTVFIGMFIEAFIDVDEKFLSDTFHYLSRGRHHAAVSTVLDLVPPHRKLIIEEAIRACDTDGDGYIELDDFMRLAVVGPLTHSSSPITIL